MGPYRAPSAEIGLPPVVVHTSNVQASNLGDSSTILAARVADVARLDLDTASGCQRCSLESRDLGLGLEAPRGHEKWLWWIWPTVTSVCHVLTVVSLTETTELRDSQVKILFSTIFTTSNNHIDKEQL